MTDWVRFHREIRQGEKRGLARATRFVYMELSQEARTARGEIVLPVGMSDEDGVHDILGGNRKEVVEAIRELAKGDDPMVRIETRGAKRVLVVLRWAKWNPVSDSTGAERQRKHREKTAKENATVTAGNDVTLRDVTVPVTSPDPLVTEPRAGARFSSLSSDLSHPDRDLKEQGAGQVVESSASYVRLKDAISRELRDAASMVGVQDVDTAWLKFAGSRNGTFLANTVGGEWQSFCASWASNERKARDLARKGEPAPDTPARRRIEPLPTLARGGGWPRG
jgi:hypothetical protein